MSNKHIYFCFIDFYFTFTYNIFLFLFFIFLFFYLYVMCGHLHEIISFEKDNCSLFGFLCTHITPRYTHKYMQSGRMVDCQLNVNDFTMVKSISFQLRFCSTNSVAYSIIASFFLLHFWYFLYCYVSNFFDFFYSTYL